jgi:CxxC-x17-CxxC domain-containing protein
LDLIIAHQYIGQLVTDSSTAVRDAVFGNVGTMVSFRVGAADAEALELEFTPEFLQNDLISLPNYNIYIKLMIDGITSRPFSAQTLAPAPIDRANPRRNEIIAISRKNYSRDRVDAEREITNWAGGTDVPSNAPPQNAQGSPSPASSPKPLYQPTGTPLKSSATTLYNAICANCGKPTKTIFEPKEGRPVYCKSCLKKMKAQKTDGAPKQAAPARSQPSQPVNKPGNDSALSALGIEFGPAKPAQKPTFKPSPPQPFDSAQGKQQVKAAPLAEIMKKGEQVFFNQKKKKKEVDLSDLKKTLDAALENAKKEEPHDPTAN